MEIHVKNRTQEAETHTRPEAESRAGPDTDAVANGAAVAAYLAAGIGTFALGLIIVLNAAGIYSAPAIYEPAGGVTGRTTLAVLVWLIAWGTLHWRWRDRHVAAGRIHVVTLILVFLGIAATVPLLWALL